MSLFSKDGKGSKPSNLPALSGPNQMPAVLTEPKAGGGGLQPATYNSQAGSQVGGHQIQGNFNQTTINHASRAASVVEQLLAKLQDELDNDIQCSDVIRKLQRYHGGTAKGGVQGLRAKLEVAGREYELDDALEQKEMFVKLLEEFSLYASAQEIFVYLLAQTERVFNSEILPQVSSLSIVDINHRTNKLILDPLVQECGATVFQMDHLTAMGLVYWLAEQCFVRWH